MEVASRHRVRRCVPADEPEVVALLNVAAADLRTLPWLVYDSEDFRDRPLDFVSRRTRDGLLDPEGVFVAVSGDAVIGTVACWCRPEESIALLQWIVVHPDWRGRGVGTALLDRCEEHARARGCTELLTERWVDSRSRALCRRLSSHGFRQQRRQQMNVTMRAALHPERLDEPSLPRGYRIRTLQPGDEATWVRLKNAVFSSHTTVEWFRDTHLTQPDFYPPGWFFAERRDEPVGIANVILHAQAESDRLHGTIEWVGAVPEVRGKGIGRALTVACMRMLYEHGLDDALLITQYFRKPAVGLYRSLGFRVAREHTMYGKRVLGSS